MKLLTVFFVGCCVFAQTTINPPAITISSDAARILRGWMSAQITQPRTELTAAAGVADTTLVVADSSAIDANTMLDIAGEHVLVTAKEENTLTVVRGSNGTTPAAASAGALVGVMEFRTMNQAVRALMVRAMRDIIRRAELRALETATAAAAQAAEAKTAAAVQ